MSLTPLADCTNGVMQEANKANNSVGNVDLKKIVRRHTHNPYIKGILSSVVTAADTFMEKRRHEPNPNAPAFIPGEIPCNTYIPYMSLAEPNYVEEPVFDSSNNMYGSPYYYAQRMAPSFVNPALVSYQLPQDTAESMNSSSVADKTMNLSNNSASCGNTGTSVVSTPIKRSNNLYKMYVDGRPKVVRSVMYAEVKVELRMGNDIFYVKDVPQVFGVIVKADDLIGRHVIVEGDRGEDLGVIVSVERSEQEPVNPLEKAEDGNKHHACVLREAVSEEVEAFRGLDKLEEEALRFCRAAIHSLNMRTPLQVQRAVFQFDRKKLTFTYSSDSYVEFKALLRALNRQYQCRIWMHQLNWEMNCRQRPAPESDGHRKSRREPHKRNAAKKHTKKSHETDE